MAGFLDLLGGGGLDPASMGWLMANGLNPAQSGMVPPSEADAQAAASAQLAAKMRQQSTDVPPAKGDTFDQRFQNAGWLMNQASPDVPLPQPRPASAPGPAVAAPPAPPPAPAAALPPAALPPAALPTQGPAPPVAAAAASPGPGPFDRIAATLANFGAGGRAGGLFGALGGAIQGATTGQRIDPIGVQNQTAQALINRHIDPDLAQIIARDPAMLNQVLPLAMGITPWEFKAVNTPAGGQRVIGYNPRNPTQSIVVKPGAAPQQGISQQSAQPAQPNQPPLVRQNGHTYQRQLDGTYRAIQ